jgi:uncharacterized protein YciI
LVSYAAAEGFLELAKVHKDAHVSALQSFYDRGLLTAAGPLLDPFNGDAISVFTTREAATEFIDQDPFVRHGVVNKWTVREWQDFFAE